MVRAVREVLGLERDPLGLAVMTPSRADERAVQEVAAVDLHAGLGRVLIKRAAAFGIAHGGAEDQGSVVWSLAIENEVVVVAKALCDLRMTLTDALPMRCGVRKSKGVPATGASSPVGT